MKLSPAIATVLVGLHLIGGMSLRAAEPMVITDTDALGEVAITIPAGKGACKFVSSYVAPGITKQFRFEFADKSAAVIITTKIRADLPKDDSILKRAIPRYERMQADFPEGNFRFELRGAAPNRTFESVLVNAGYNELYPLALAAENGDGLKSVGVSQFFVVGGRYIECAAYVPQHDALSRADLIQEAKAACLQWRQATKLTEAKP